MNHGHGQPVLSICIKRFCILFLAMATVFVWGGAPLPVLGQGRDSRTTTVPFQDRLRHYLDENTQEVVEELVAKEQQLLQLVQNIHLEVASRGKEGVHKDQAGFRRLYSHQDTLIRSYQYELERMVQVYDDLQKLKRVAAYRGNPGLLSQVEESTYDVLRTMDNRNLYKKGIYTATRVGALMDDYTSELDSLLTIYDALERARLLAGAQQNQQALADIDRQQAQLYRVLSSWNKLGPVPDTTFMDLRSEAGYVSRVMQQIDSLQAGGRVSEAARLEAIKAALLQRVDRSVIDLLTKSGYSLSAYPTVSDFIEVWKKERLVDIKTRLTEYLVLNRNLIDSATPEQRDRMLNRELTALSVNFAEGKYRLTENQINSVQEHYGHYYAYMTPLTYYLAECRYHRQAQEAARPLYLSLAADTSADRFRPAALIRLLQYEHAFDLQRDFLVHYDAISKDRHADAEQKQYAHYLAANRFFDKEMWSECQSAVQAVPAGSPYRMPAQLLSAIAWLNQNDFTQAVPILESLIDETIYPWTDLQTSYIRNTALLKLGMVYYQRGEFPRANDFFNRVSKGFADHDQALIGQAWASLRLGDYNASLSRTHQLLNSFLASNFTYEALTLAGHCQRLMNQPHDALNAYRYVVRSQNERAKKQEYNQERDRLKTQSRELDRLEKESLERRQVDLYADVERIKNQINAYVVSINERTDTGTQLLQDYYEERVDLFAKLDELQTVIEVAEREERPDIADKARKQLARLIRVLQTYRSDQNVVNTAFLVDFPLAAREASLEYKRNNLASVYRDLEMEKRRLERNVELVAGFEHAGEKTVAMASRSDLEILRSDLDHLRDRMSVLRKRVVEEQPAPSSSDAETWSDLSGFGMTDIIYRERMKRLSTIDDYAVRLKGIETVLSDRRHDIEVKLQLFEDEIRVLQDNLLSRKIQLDQMERQTYFEKFYFDEKEQEESWEPPSTTRP